MLSQTLVSTSNVVIPYEQNANAYIQLRSVSESSEGCDDVLGVWIIVT